MLQCDYGGSLGSRGGSSLTSAGAGNYGEPRGWSVMPL